MRITCWGARGSIPVSGGQFVKYGGDTTCIEIRTKHGGIVIIDAGSGIRALGNKLVKENRREYTLLFTHAHWDHIMGFPFFKPLYESTTVLDVFGCPFAQDSVKDMLSPSMKPPSFPVDIDAVKASITYHGACSGSFILDSLEVSTILLSHPNKGIGYSFTEDGKRFVFLTDNEITYRHPGGLEWKDYEAFAEGAEFLVHDAEFTRDEYRSTKAWGHTVYTDALQLAVNARVKRLGLFHHNQDRTDEALDEIVSDCRRILSRQGNAMECFALEQGMTVTV